MLWLLGIDQHAHFKNAVMLACPDHAGIFDYIPHNHHVLPQAHRPIFHVQGLPFTEGCDQRQFVVFDTRPFEQIAITFFQLVVESIRDDFRSEIFSKRLREPWLFRLQQNV